MKRLAFAAVALVGLATIAVPPTLNAGWGSCRAAVAAPKDGWDSEDRYWLAGRHVQTYDRARHLVYDFATRTWFRPEWARPTVCPDGCGCDSCCEECQCADGKPCGSEDCTCAAKERVVNPAHVMDLPVEVRKWYRNPDGSCVQCSLGMCGADQNDPTAATLLWDTEYGPKERGGSYPQRVENYCNRRGIRAWNVTGRTTFDWMRWACTTGRGCAIGAGASHFQTLYGHDETAGRWYVCNNNSPAVIDEYTDEQFRRLHLASGPWVVVLKAPPHPVRPEYRQWWAEAGGYGQTPAPQIDRDAVIRCGDMVQEMGDGIRDEGYAAFKQAISPPADDSHKWFISVISAQACAPCAKLKSDWAKSQELLAWARPDDAAASWAHFRTYDKDDASQQFRFEKVRIAAYPTVILQPPRNGSYGDPASVVFQRTGYSGDPKALADAMRDAMKRYVAALPKREGGPAQRAPWQPPPKTPAVPPDPTPVPLVIPGPNVPPDVPPAVAGWSWWTIGSVVVGSLCLLAFALVAALAFTLTAYSLYRASRPVKLPL